MEGDPCYAYANPSEAPCGVVESVYRNADGLLKIDVAWDDGSVSSRTNVDYARPWEIEPEYLAGLFRGASRPDEPAVVEPAAEPAAEPAVVEPAVVEPAVVEPAAEPAVTLEAAPRNDDRYDDIYRASATLMEKLEAVELRVTELGSSMSRTIGQVCSEIESAYRGNESMETIRHIAASYRGAADDAPPYKGSRAKPADPDAVTELTYRDIKELPA